MLLIRLAFISMFLIQCTTTSSPSDKLVHLGNEYAKDGLLREAAEAYKKALERQEDHRIARRNLGIVQVKAGSYDQAIKNFEAVIDQFENDFEANFYLAEALRAMERHADAIYRYKKAIQLEPENLRASKALAWSYFKIRYYKEALSVANKLYQKNSTDPQVSIILARTLIKVKNTTAAMKVLQKAKKYTKPESMPYLQSVEGDILLAQEKCSSAIPVYREALKTQPLLAGALLGLGQCSLEVGNTSQAISYMERAIRLRPNMTEALYLLGKAYETQDPKKSMQLYRHFRKQAAKDPEFMARINEAKKRYGVLNSKLKQKSR